MPLIFAFLQPVDRVFDRLDQRCPCSTTPRSPPRSAEPGSWDFALAMPGEVGRVLAHLRQHGFGLGLGGGFLGRLAPWAR